MDSKTGRIVHCGECGEPMACRLSVVPYDTCGLNNVQLRNVPVWGCANGHEDVVIPAIDQLHRLLTEAIIDKPINLVGPEVRFLRKQLGFSAKAFAHMMGISPVSLSRLENEHRQIGRTVDRLVRLLVATTLSERENRPLPKKILPILEELEQGSLDMTPYHLLEHIPGDGCGTAHPGEQEWRQAASA